VQIACREEAAIARARQEGLVEGYFCVGIDLQPSRNGCGRLSDPSTSNTLELLTWTSVPASSTISGTCRCDSSSVDSELGALVNQSLATGLSLHGIRRLPTSTMATSARVYRSLQTCSHQPTHRRSMFPRGGWPSLVVTVVSKRLPQRGRLTTPSIVRLTPSVALGRAGRATRRAGALRRRGLPSHEVPPSRLPSHPAPLVPLPAITHPAGFPSLRRSVHQEAVPD